jgi:hypothetical protein
VIPLQGERPYTGLKGAVIETEVPGDFTMLAKEQRRDAERGVKAAKI